MLNTFLGLNEVVRRQLTEIAKDLSEDQFRKIFFDTLHSQSSFPNFAEVLIAQTPDDHDLDELVTKYEAAFDKFTEEFWTANIHAVPVGNLIQMAFQLRGDEIPDNFVELFTLHPDYDSDFRDSQRIGDPNVFQDKEEDL